MQILLTGTSGQAGRELRRSLAVLGQLDCPQRADLDLSQPDSIIPYLDATKPGLIVNPAAYTAVDSAEQEPDIAMAVNRDSPAKLALWCAQNDAALVHFSTDYVYDGTGTDPFTEQSTPAPKGVYGQSKLAGDNAVLRSGASHLIFRTSWVYASQGKNFLNTMLRLAGSGKPLRVVGDQTGAPTPARLLADACLSVLSRFGTNSEALRGVSGLYHLAPTGEVSWHGFAQAIMQHRMKVTGEPMPEVQAITTEEYPTPAARPANSRLALTRAQKELGLHLPSWQDCLAQVMQERLEAGRNPD